MHERDLLKIDFGDATALMFGPWFWRSAFAAPAEVGPRPHAPLGLPDALGRVLLQGVSVDGDGLTFEVSGPFRQNA